MATKTRYKVMVGSGMEFYSFISEESARVKYKQLADAKKKVKLVKLNQVTGKETIILKRG
jgi:hypothetical protein